MVTGFEVECASEINIFEYSLIPLNPVTNTYMKSKNKEILKMYSIW